MHFVGATEYKEVAHRYVKLNGNEIKFYATRMRIKILMCIFKFYINIYILGLINERR